MRHAWRAPLVLLLTLIVCSLGARAYTWYDAEVGSPTATGGHTENGGGLTVTGAGTGDTWTGNDQLHYTYTTNAGGDLDVIVRLTGFSGAAHGRAGIMVRTANAANAATANTVFAYQDAADGKHNIFFTARDQASSTGTYSGVTTKMALPVWLRLVRTGKRFAVYKSPDGVIWTMLGNTSGWQFTPTGALEVGVFVASGSAATTATATFDNISIGTPHLGYTSSWYGNNFGSNIDDGHVSNGISAMWVGPDGSCYTNSGWDEGAEASKIYKDGKVVKGLRDGNEYLGNALCGEGSITSDGTNLYLANTKYLYKTDMLGTQAATAPVYLSIDPYDTTRGLNIISGLAAANNEIYIADSRDQKIRVAQPSITTYYTAGNTNVYMTTQTIDTTGVPGAAPAAVYQSQRKNDYNPYIIPGLTPNTRYNVRCHFCEIFQTEVGKRIIEVYASGATPVTGYDVVAAAGGAFKPAVLNIANALTDATGKLNITFTYGAGSVDHHVAICGIEILTTGGTQVFALNCGGPAVGSFQSEVNELPARAFDFTRPGPMTVDSRGDLWIIQEANDFPIGTKITTAYPGAVKCYHPNGTYANKQITGVVNPAAIAYDAVNDRLLIADNTNQDIVIYGNLTTTPTQVGTFGQLGGLYAGSNPGLINDPAAGGYARFYGISGLGVDSAGNIYVSTGMQGTDLRKFTPGGALVWMLNGLFFCNTPDLDPDTDGQDAYSTYWHGTLDYTKTAPGSEWAFKGYNWNPNLYGDPPRQAAAQAIFRRVGPNRAKIMYTSGQGLADYVGIFRYNGEIAVPCGQIRDSGATVWIDANGDGLETANERVTGAAPGGLSTFCVDDNGDVWLACLSGDSAIMRHFKLQGMTANGAPIYDLTPGHYEDIPFPGTGQPISTWGMSAAMFYDAVRDSMYLSGPAVARVTEQNDQVNYLARYDNWSTGNRTPRWFFTLPNPDTSVNFMYEVGRPWGCVHRWMGLDVAAEKLFTADLWGDVYVYRTTDGTLERILNAGPEISGCCAWEDAAMGLTAFKRSNGEFIVFTENSGWGGKPNMFRLPPSGTNLAPSVTLTGPQATDLFVTPATVTLTANAQDDDGTISKVEFYQGSTKVGEDSTRPYTCTWSNATTGNYTLTAKAYDNQNAVTTSAPVMITVRADYPPTVSITSPAANTVFTSVPASVTITATAADPDGTVSKVEFFQGTTKLGEDTTSPYSFTWNNVQTGSYTLTVRAWDADGCATTSSAVAITAQSCTSTDLFAGLTVGTVVNGQYGWTRDPQVDGTSGNYGQLQYTNTEGAPAQAPCMKARAVGSSGYMFAYRDLGTNSGLASWKITGDLAFAYQYTGDKRAQFRILVKDDLGNVIANLDRLTWDWGDAYNYVKFNGQTVVSGTVADTSPVDNLCNVWNSFSIENSNGTLTFTYGGHTVTTAALSGSTAGNPKTLCILVGENNYYGETLYLDNLAFTRPDANQSPTVSLTAPSAGDIFIAPATAILTANAADCDGTISKVEFYQGATKLGEDTTSPFSYTVSGLAEGSYSFTAKAYDNGGLSAVSDAVTVTVNNGDLFLGLSVGTVYDGLYGWTRDFPDDSLRDGSNYGLVQYTNTEGSAVNPPCLKVYTHGSSGHQYAYRDLGTNSGLASWRIDGDMKFAYNNLADKRTQVRILVEDANGAVIADYDRLTWDWGGTDYVQFNNQNVVPACTWPDTTAIDNLCNNWNHFSIANNNGTLTFTYGGNTVTASALYGSTAGSPKTLCILVGENNYWGEVEYLDNLYFAKNPPTVSLTAPAAGTYETSTITLAATASDSDGISKVEFYQGSTLIGTATASPYSLTWSNVAAGTYSLTAKAYDSYNVPTTSAPVSILVRSVTDLFAGLSVGTVVNGQYGWTRDFPDDSLRDGSNYGLVQYTTTEGSAANPPCLKVYTHGSSGHQFAYRDLGANSGLGYWKIACDLKFAYNNVNDKRTQMKIVVKDASGNAIATLDRLTWDWTWDCFDYLRFNGQNVVPACTWPDTTAIDTLCNSWNSLKIEAQNGQLTLTYGTNTVTVSPGAGSTWSSPASLEIRVGDNNYYGEVEYVDNLVFVK